jgi:hypothetical protein
VIGKTHHDATEAIHLLPQILSFATMLPLFQSPMNITTELSTIKERGKVIGWSCVAWSFGNCALPFLAWGLNM